MKTSAALAIASTVAAPPIRAAPTMMTAQWAKQMCSAWNADATVTGKLVESEWIRNDKSRGYKAMQIHLSDCADSPRIELHVSEKGGKALCVYGGKAGSTLDTRVDYVMWAETARWQPAPRTCRPARNIWARRTPPVARGSP